MSRNRLLALLGFLAFVGSNRAAPPGTSVIAPFVDQETTAVVRIDLARLDVMKSAHRLLGEFVDKGPRTQPLRDLAKWTESLRKAGAAEAYILLRVTEDTAGPAMIVPLAPGADPEKLGRALQGAAKENPDERVTRSVFGTAVFSGYPGDLQRAEAAGAKTPMPAWLADAMKAEPDGEVRIMLAMNPALRQTIEQQSPNLPPVFGGVPSKVLTQGLKWAAIGIHLDSKAKIRVSARAADAEAAQAIERVASTTLKTLGPATGQALKAFGPEAAEAPGLPKLIGQVAIKVDGTSLTTGLDIEAIADEVRPLLAQIAKEFVPPPCVNHLKQIMLAMHNYHDANNSFPPAFKANDDGKPLLSWRVLILPFLGEANLFQEFHLDEPWDSPHNKTLISKMPDVYRCSELAADKAREGKTTFVTPRGEQTIFPGAEAVGINNITDGTSNTIAVIDAPAKNMVVWTAPDDLDVSELVVDIHAPKKLKPETILKQHGGGSYVGFADGSVRRLKGIIDQAVFGALLTNSGGEVISADSF